MIAPAKNIKTVRELVDQFGIQRRGEGSDYDKEMQRFRDHVLPVLGTLKVVDVRPRHAHELVMALRRTESRKGGVLAPRTIRQIYFSTKQLFQYALLQELLPGNPILVGKGVLFDLLLWRQPARGFALRAIGGGTGQHAVFGGDPALALAAQEGRQAGEGVEEVEARTIGWYTSRNSSLSAARPTLVMRLKRGTVRTASASPRPVAASTSITTPDPLRPR